MMSFSIMVDVPLVTVVRDIRLTLQTFVVLGDFYGVLELFAMNVEDDG